MHVLMTEQHEPQEGAVNTLNEVETQEATAKESPEVVEDGSEATNEQKKPNRFEKLKGKLDEKDDTISHLQQQIDTIKEDADKRVAWAKFGAEVFENDKVRAFKENMMNKDGSALSREQAADMAGISPRQSFDAPYIPWMPAAPQPKKGTEEMTLDELEAQVSKDFAEGKLQL